MTVVKFCGLRSPEDVGEAVHSGCDLIGLNFVGSSPRCITQETASAIAESHRSSIVFVGVFHDPDASEVDAILSHVDISFLQFSGEESEDFCNSFGVPYIKTMHVGETFDFDRERDKHTTAWAYLLDTATPLGGGTGKTFDWELFPASADAKILLAGGLTPENVGQAITQLNPWGVDVASGIENAQKKKDRSKMVRFMDAVQRVRA